MKAVFKYLKGCHTEDDLFSIAMESRARNIELKLEERYFSTCWLFELSVVQQAAICCDKFSFTRGIETKKI